MKPASSSSPSEFLDYALRYASRGWRVFPCHPATKAPATKHGFQDATVEPLVIRAWWTGNPNFNVAIACDQFFVLDVDPRNNGHLSLEDLEEQHGRLPDTVQQITGGGGRQYWFSLPDGDAPKNSSGAVGAGLDIKAPGGYVMAPPSVHDKTGKTYIFDGNQEFEQQQLAPAPAWLLKLIRTSAKKVSPIDEIPSVIPDGKRNATITAYAGKMRRMGIPPAAILAACTAINNERCQPPLPTREIERTVESICRYEPDKLSEQAIRRIISEPVTESPQQQPVVEDWTSQLSVTLKGETKKLLCNSVTALSISAAYHGAFRFNEFTSRSESTRSLCRGLIKADTPIGDREVLHLTVDLQKNMFIENAESVTHAAVQTVSHYSPYHPVRDYLRSIVWDGIRRIDSWLVTYAGVEQSEYAFGIGRNWLVAAVARVMEPGCQADNCVILEGKQGIGKSNTLRILGGEWFTDSLSDVTTKDAAIDLAGKWIIEVSEMHSFNREKKAAVKGFVTREIDHYRPPYGRTAIDAPRQCVFGGTTNELFYFEEEDNRRFWPVYCRVMDTKSLARDRDQLWAEAFSIYSETHKWHFDDIQINSEIAAQQSERRIEEPFAGPIAKHILTLDLVTTNELMLGPLQSWTHGTKQDERRCCDVLRAMGWSPSLKRIHGVPKRVWTKPD